MSSVLRASGGTGICHGGASRAKTYHLIRFRWRVTAIPSRGRVSLTWGFIGSCVKWTMRGSNRGAFEAMKTGVFHVLKNTVGPKVGPDPSIMTHHAQSAKSPNLEKQAFPVIDHYDPSQEVPEWAIQDSNYTHIPRGIRKFQKKRRIIRRIACTKPQPCHLIFNA